MMVRPVFQLHSLGLPHLDLLARLTVIIVLVIFLVRAV
jgi:hypothetical protein